MSEIRIKINEVKSLDSSLKRITSNLITARTNVSSIRYSVDSRILARRNIGARINNSCNSIGTLENKLQTLQSFIDTSMDRYGTAVNNVDKKALELGSIEKEKSGGFLDWLSNIESDIFGNKSPLGSFEALFEDIETDVSKEWKLLSSMVSLDFNKMYNFVENSWNKLNEESKEIWNAAQIAWSVEKSTHPLGSGLLSGIVDSVKGGTIDLIAGVLTQVSDLIKNPVNTLEEWGQTLYTIKCITQPMTAQEMEIRDKVIEGLWTNIKNDFTKDVINGDEYSRTKYFTSAAVTIGSFFVGVGEIKAAAAGSDALKGIEAVEDVDKVAEGLSNAELNTCDSIKKVINDNGYSVDEFVELLHPDRVLNEDEKVIVDSVRDEIGIPDIGTKMKKVIPQSDIYNYLYDEKYTGIKGFTAVDEHGANLKTLYENYEGARLDYDETMFKVDNGVNGVSKPIGAPDRFYGTIEYIENDPSKLVIPRWEANAENYPYTAKGFTGSKNIVLPEFTYERGYERAFQDGDTLNIIDSKTGKKVQQFIYDKTLDEKWIMVGGK